MNNFAFRPHYGLEELLLSKSDADNLQNIKSAFNIFFELSDADNNISTSAKLALKKIKNHNTKKLDLIQIDLNSGKINAYDKITQHFISEVKKKANNSEDINSLAYQLFENLSSLDQTSKSITSPIVGNENFVRSLTGCFDMINLYDNNLKLHPHIELFGNFNNRILGYGPPGTGKSSTINFVLSKYDFETINLSGNIKSKYFGESSNNIINIFDKVNVGDKKYVIIADDIDTTVFPRNNTEHSENISIFGELIKGLESTYSNNLGNYCFIATTNHLENIDAALLRRFQEKIFVAGPESVNDYNQLLQNKLQGYIQHGFIPSDTSIIAKYMCDKKFTGSEATNFANKVSAKIVKTPNNQGTYTKNQKAILQSYNKITQDELEQMVKDELYTEKKKYSMSA